MSTTPRSISGRVVALSGGIGGAKLALGLSHVISPRDLTVVANTGDDFVHLGLRISPDIDTLTYVLAGLDDPVRGWGRRDETWTFMKALAQLGGDTWFQLGDGDLALHVERTRRLTQGETLSAITRDIGARLGIDAQILPMSDDPVTTRVRIQGGWIDFQDYFVRRRCEPSVQEITFAGAADAKAQPEVLAALADPTLRAVVICPSNPLISIEPILSIKAIREALKRCSAPVVAVSPIIGGQAVKGPTAKMLRELGIESSAASVARRYGDLIDGYIIDTDDSAEAKDIAVHVAVTRTLMKSLDDRKDLARMVLETADAIKASALAQNEA